MLNVSELLAALAGGTVGCDDSSTGPETGDAFTDLGTFLTFDPSFYSPNAIAALPGGEYRGLDVAADGRSLVAALAMGASLVVYALVSLLGRRRDFDLDRLIGQDITALNALFEQGVMDRDEFRQILVQGEILPTATESTAEEELLETPEQEVTEDEML